MLKQADITAENMAPGTIERLGLDYESVKKINPGIIYCRIKGFSPGSPHEKGLAFDMIAQAAGGPISVTGEPGRPPVKPGLSFGDTGTGMLMAATILGALHERARTGHGRLLEIAMQEAMIHYMRTCFCDDEAHRQAGAAQRRQAVGTATTRRPASTRPRAAAPTTMLYLTTSRANPEHWTRLMKLVGREDLLEDPRLRHWRPPASSPQQGTRPRSSASGPSSTSKREAMQKLIEVGVPAGCGA